MNSFRSKPVGWRYESSRHSLAARGYGREKVDVMKAYAQYRVKGQSWVMDAKDSAGKLEELRKDMIAMPQGKAAKKDREVVRREVKKEFKRFDVNRKKLDTVKYPEIGEQETIVWAKKVASGAKKIRRGWQ
jgi:hypothetical protein